MTGNGSAPRVVFVTGDVLDRPSGGAAVKTSALAAALARGTRLTVLAVAPGRPPGEQLVSTPFGPSVQRIGLPAEQLADALDRMEPDVVVADDPSLGVLLLAVPAVADRVIVHVPSIDSGVYADEASGGVGVDADGARRAAAHRARLAGLTERTVMARARQLWTVSAEDRDELIAKGAAARIAVVPNVAMPVSSPVDPAAGREVRFVGQLWYGPNLDAAHRLRELALAWREAGHDWPVSIAGLGADETQRAALSPVETLGFVPELREVFADAAVVVVPLRYGSGTKVKMLDAMSHGAAVVTTPEGVRGLPCVVDGVHALIRPMGPAFARAVEDLMADTGARRQLGDAARALAVAEWGFDRLQAAVDDALLRARV